MSENNITITMPKYNYDCLLAENIKLRKELELNKYKTYIYFRSDDRRCKSLDFDGLYNNLTGKSDIPEVITKLNEEIQFIIEGVNQKLQKDTIVKEKYEKIYIEMESKKSFWKSILDIN